MTTLDDVRDSLPTLTPISDVEQQRGGDPMLLRDELVHVIRTWLGNRPRSLQTSVGPSGLGTPCARQLGYRLAGVAEIDGRPPGWLPGIGVAVHDQLERVFRAYNAATGYERYLIETRVEVGTVAGRPVFGTSDLYDQVTATVVDWKIVGKSTLDRARRHGMSAQYRVQAHLYGRGFALRGLPVDTVAICYLPRNEELTGTQYVHEPYDERIALDAIARADAIATALTLTDAATILPQLATVDDCRFCPFRRHGAPSSSLLDGCPGVADRPPSLAESLIASD
jgi:hypothetical protein